MISDEETLFHVTKIEHDSELGNERELIAQILSTCIFSTTLFYAVYLVPFHPFLIFAKGVADIQQSSFIKSFIMCMACIYSI